MNNSLGRFSIISLKITSGAVAVLVAGSLTLGGSLFARTASCPCPNPCPCSPCTCGGGGGKSQPTGGSKAQPTPAKTTSTSDKTKTTSNHHEGTADKSHHHGGGCGHAHRHGGCGGGGVGVSVYIPDGLGARKQEGDPFATTPQQPVGHTQEKPERPRTNERDVVKTNLFNDVQFTGPEAKGDLPPPNVENVSDNVTGGGGGDSAKPEGSPAKNDVSDTIKALEDARTDYVVGRAEYTDKLTVDVGALREELRDIWNKKGADSKEYQRKVKKFNKLLTQIDEAFAKSENGKKLFAAWMSAYEKAYKTGEKIPKGAVPTTEGPKMSESPGTSGLDKQAAVDDAKKALDAEQKKYDAMKDKFVSEHSGVKNIQAAIDNANGDPEKVKGLQSDLDKAKKEVGKEWAAAQEGKDQMKKVVDAEKALDQAKQNAQPKEGLDKATVDNKAKP